MSRANHLLRKFGITEEQYDELLRKQGSRCAICKRSSSTFRHRLAVDHNHKTGDIRGLLCFHCNRYIIGRHSREVGAELLLAAYKYLIAEYPGWIVPPKPKRKKHRARKFSRKKSQVRKDNGDHK